MKVVLVVLLILAAGAGAWFSGLSDLFGGGNGQYQDARDLITYRTDLKKEIVLTPHNAWPQCSAVVKSEDVLNQETSLQDEIAGLKFDEWSDKSQGGWTGMRNTMLKERGKQDEIKLTLTSDKATATQARDEQLSKEADLKEEETRLDADLTKIDAQIKELKDKLAEFGVTSIKEIQEKMEFQEAANKKLEEEITELAGNIDTASKKRAEQQSELDKRQSEQAEYRATLARNSAEYPILSVDPMWGFAVIGVGQNTKTNIDHNTVLLVVRNGKSIGKLKVTSIEKNQTIADIVKGSVAPGMTIEPGDRVQLLTPLQSLK